MATDIEYRCVMKPPKRFKLKSKKWTLKVQPFQVENFTIKNGKKVPGGIKFNYLKFTA